MRMVSDWVRMVEDEHSLGHHQEEAEEVGGGCDMIS